MLNDTEKEKLKMDLVGKITNDMTVAETGDKFCLQLTPIEGAVLVENLTAINDGEWKQRYEKEVLGEGGLQKANSTLTSMLSVFQTSWKEASSLLGSTYSRLALHTGVGGGGSGIPSIPDLRDSIHQWLLKNNFMGNRSNKAACPTDWYSAWRLLDDTLLNLRSWEKDFPEENGKYINNCCNCTEVFLGNKHRVVCRLCACLTDHLPHSKSNALDSDFDAARQRKNKNLPSQENQNG